MIYCPECNTANRDGSRFCNECGANLQRANRRCQACGTLNPADRANCLNCGARLVLHADSEPAELPEEEGAVSPAGAPPAASHVAPAPGAQPAADSGTVAASADQSPAPVLVPAEAAPGAPSEPARHPDVSISPAAAEELPGWLRDLPPEHFELIAPEPSAPSGEAAAEQNAPAAPASDGLPTWLRELRQADGNAPQAAVEETAAESVDTGVAPVPAEIPGWLSELGAPPSGVAAGLVSAESPDAPPPATESESLELQPAETPEWLKGLAPPQPVAYDESSLSDVDMEELPDWLKPVGAPKRPSAEQPAPAEPAAPATAESSLITAPVSEPGVGELVPGEIPAWLQALKPGGIPSTSDEMIETSGLLAGIRGALPVESVLTAPHGSTDLRAASASAKPLPVTGFSDLFTPRPAGLTAEEAGVAPARARQARWSLRLILALLILLVAAMAFLPLPFLSDWRGANITGHQPASDFYQTINQVNALHPGGIVLLGVDYAAGARGELDPQAHAAILHLLQNKQRIVAVSFVADGGLLAQDLLNTSSPAVTSFSYPYAYGETHVNIGYLSGSEAAMRSLVQSGLAPSQTDFRGKPLSDLPLARAVKSLKDVNLIVAFSDDGAQVRRWVEQIGRDAGSPLLVGVSAAAEPAVAPYYDSRQISGLLAGQRGAAEYEGFLGRPATASAALDGISYVVILLVIVIVAALIAGVVVRRARPASSGGRRAA